MDLDLTVRTSKSQYLSASQVLCLPSAGGGMFLASVLGKVMNDTEHKSLELTQGEDGLR